MTRVVGFFSKLLLLAFSLAVALGATELLLRAAWRGYYDKNVPIPRFEPHETRGYENARDAEYRQGKPEWVMHVRTNSLGFRGGEPRDEKLRILAVGDSFTFGYGVSEDETWTTLLDRAHEEVEVINAGVPGYGTAHELLLLEEHGPTLRPDIVLLAFFWNDVLDSYHAEIPRFRTEGGELIREVPAPDAVASKLRTRRSKERLLARSYAYRFFSDRAKIARFRLRQWFGMGDIHSFGTDRKVFEEAWALQEALLRAFASASREIGAKLLLIVIPDQVQVHTEWRVAGAGGLDLDIQDRLGEIASSLEIETLDLLPGLNAARGDSPLYFRQDRHLTALGNRIVAELVRSRLEDEAWWPVSR